MKLPTAAFLFWPAYFFHWMEFVPGHIVLIKCKLVDAAAESSWMPLLSVICGGTVKESFMRKINSKMQSNS